MQTNYMFFSPCAEIGFVFSEKPFVVCYLLFEGKIQRHLHRNYHIVHMHIFIYYKQ